MINPIKQVDAQKLKLTNNVRTFLREYGVLAVAVGMIFATAFKDFVDAIVKGFVLPLINLIFPTSELTSLVVRINSVAFNIGNIMSSALTLIIVVLVLYILVKKILQGEKKENK